VKDIRSLFGHVNLYKKFIRDFSKIAKPLSLLLAEDVLFQFSMECEGEFTMLKEALSTALILCPPLWEEQLELMCDVFDYVVWVVLCRIIDKKGPYNLLCESYIK